MGQVWDLDLPTNEQLILLAMADHADHEGENIWPSVGLIAWKTGYSERTIQRVIKSLLGKDVLQIQKRRPGKTTIYCTAFENANLKPKRKKKDTPDAHVTPDTKDVIPTPDAQMSPEPSLEPSIMIKDSASPDGNADTEFTVGVNNWDGWMASRLVSEGIYTNADYALEMVIKLHQTGAIDHGADYAAVLEIVKRELVAEPDEHANASAPVFVMGQGWKNVGGEDNAPPDEPKPKKERKVNPWYDAVKEVFDLHGGRNRLMVGLLQGKATKNGHKDYNLEEPITDHKDILKFGRWWKANHDGLTMVQSPLKVQSEVMGWQAQGCPDAIDQPKTHEQIARERLAQGLPYAY